ncbi:MAG TPA: 16S rRNA methyltransferase [Anaerolineae bacterium]
MDQEKQLDALVERVVAGQKYRYVSRDLIRQVGGRELAIRRNLKEAVKATKNKLHQVGGAYFETVIDYEQALADLRAARGDPAAFRQVCRDIMNLHASTRERLPILDDFFNATLAELPPIRVVMDVACGLNPLARPWMPFGDQIEYLAYDIYTDMIDFIREFLEIAGVKGQAEVRDVIGNPPAQPADLAFILKTLPCLEQVDKTAASRLLDTIQASYLLISYPARSLGGRRKGMVENYEAHFWALAGGRNWIVQRFEFPTELAFLVEV